MERYAVYFTPDQGTPLADFGAAWLGRDAFTGEMIAQEELLDLSAARLFEVTANPRRYGFHGTLRAPFRPAEGVDEAALCAALDTLAARHKAFAAPAPSISDFGGFMVFLLSGPCPAMDALARDAVEHFNPLRAPLNDAEIARRMPDRLTERQRDYLQHWGYPYVMEDFIFHMTLTERLTIQDERDVIQEALEAIDSVFGTQPLPVDAVHLFKQDTPDADFRVCHRAALTG